jgi:glycosyltransferase involved in cell wall biosynthesis
MLSQVDLDVRRRLHADLCIDQVHAFDEPRPELAVLGWAVPPDRAAAEDLWLECNGERFPCLTGLARLDVARSYGTPALSQVGFLGRFPVRLNPCVVTVIASGNGPSRIVGEFRATRRPVQRPANGGSTAYGEWLRHHEPTLFWPDAEADGRLHQLRSLPLLSIILPTYNTHLYHLYRCIESVIRQRYPYWELCIADDASPDPRVRSYLNARAASDSRMRLTLCTRNAGISAASNAALATATGDFVVLLDHDDELHPSALLEVVRRLNVNPDADLVYSDEDKIDQLGFRSEPAFKADFDADMLRSFNYLGHLVALRAAVVREVGGFRSAMDGAQDWDLLLRVMSASAVERIQHIRKPLYHWRKHEASTSQSLDAKPYAIRAWNVVLSDHMNADDRVAVREGLFLGSMRLERRLAAGTRVAIVYRARDGAHQQGALRRARAPSSVRWFELMFTAVYDAERPDRGALMTIGDLDCDVTIVLGCGIDSVNHHFIEELSAQALRDDCGIVGATVAGADNQVVTAGLVCLQDGTLLNPFEGMDLNHPGYMGQTKVVRQVAAVAPHVFATRTERLTGAGGLAALGEDSLGLLCDALISSARRAGLKVLHTPYAIATVRRRGGTYRPGHGGGPGHPLLNPNLEAFPDVSAILRTGLQ